MFWPASVPGMAAPASRVILSSRMRSENGRGFADRLTLASASPIAPRCRSELPDDVATSLPVITSLPLDARLTGICACMHRPASV